MNKMEDRVIDFYKLVGLYDEELFKKIKENTTLVESSELFSFCYGVFIKDDGSFKVCLPKLNSVFDEIVWVHEYAHIIQYVKDYETDEIFPNIMESTFINMFVEDREEIIRKTEEEINNSFSKEHTLAKKIKLNIIK